MKKILFVLVIGLLIGCENDNDKNGDNNKEKDNVTEIIIKEEINDKEYIREEVVDWYEGGDKKIVCFYKGEGNSEEIIYKVIYSTDGIICCDFEYENGEKVLIKHYDKNGEYEKRFDNLEEGFCCLN